MDLTCKALSPALMEDYLYFFDNMIFTENPDWENCYCYSFHFTGTAGQWNKKNNREAVKRLISSGDMTGYMAYKSDRIVGWCNVNDRRNFQRLRMQYEIDEDSTLKICSIVCFVIAPDQRKKGIASELLDHVIRDRSRADWDLLEAYPAKNETSCEHNYKGPLNMYLKKGFSIISEHNNYYIVRKDL